MKRYIDGFVLPIATRHLPRYQALAHVAAEIWMEHGALEYCECVADDLNTECSPSFAEMTDAHENETVIFAWAIFESRQARDAANERILADPRMADLMTGLTASYEPIVNFQRMAHGGFREIVRRAQ